MRTLRQQPGWKDRAHEDAKNPRRVSSDFGKRKCDLQFGEVPEGWMRDGWRVELERKAERCEAANAGLAAYYRRWAAVVSRENGVETV